VIRDVDEIRANVLKNIPHITNAVLWRLSERSFSTRKTATPEENHNLSSISFTSKVAFHEPIALSKEVEERYRRYLKTTFLFQRSRSSASFERPWIRTSEQSPYLEATPVFKRGQPPQTLFSSVLGSPLDGGFLESGRGDRALISIRIAIQKSPKEAT